MKDKLFKLRMPKELYNNLLLISMNEKYTISFIIRTILEDYIKLYKKNNDNNE